MFVTPAFIHQYSQDLVDGLNDPEFSVLTQKFDEYLGVTAPTSGSNTP